MTLHILILYYCIICPNLVVNVLVVLLQAEHLSFATVLDVVVIIVMGAIWAIMPTDGIAIVTDWFYNRVMQVCFIHSTYIYIYIPYGLCPASEDFYGSDTSLCNHWPFALEPTPSFYAIHFINW